MYAETNTFGFVGPLSGLPGIENLGCVFRASLDLLGWMGTDGLILLPFAFLLVDVGSVVFGSGISILDSRRSNPIS